MTSSNGYLTTAELDFSAVRASLKEYLSRQDRFRDYDFDGSNMSVLLDLLAWNTHLEAHYLNMVGSEMFLDTARLQDSAYSWSKAIGYLPRSVTSARALVSFTIDTGGDDPSSVTVPKYTKFTSSSTDSTGSVTTRTFYTSEATLVQPDDNSVYRAANVEVVEGELVREVEVWTADSRSFVLTTANADVGTLTVNVQSSLTDTSNADFSLAENLYGLGPDDPVYFLQGAYDGKFEVLFGDGNLGRAVPAGSVVRLTYLYSSGSDGNGTGKFTAASQVDGYTVADVEVEERASGGAPRESVASIQFNAPRHFTTQERATVKSDFENLIRSKFPQVQAVIAYGGEEVTPKQYGRVILSMKPYGDEVLSDRVKADVLEYLEGKNVVTEPVIVDADYLYASLAVNAVRSRSSSKTQEEIRAAVAAAVVAHFEESVDDFGVTLRMSKLTRAVDDSDPSIVGSEVTVRLVKKTQPVEGTSQTLTFSFINPLLSRPRVADAANAGAIVESSPFTYRKNGVNYTSSIQDDGAGTLFLYTTNSGLRVVLESDVGTVDYDTGDVSVTIDPFSYDGNYVEFTAIPDGDDVAVRANVFLALDEASLTVTVENE